MAWNELKLYIDLDLLNLRHVLLYFILSSFLGFFYFSLFRISNLINNILDSKKGPLETSLKKIKLKLIDLTEKDFEKNDLNRSAQELVVS